MHAYNSGFDSWNKVNQEVIWALEIICNERQIRSFEKCLDGKKHNMLMFNVFRTRVAFFVVGLFLAVACMLSSVAEGQGTYHRELHVHTHINTHI